LCQHWGCAQHKRKDKLKMDGGKKNYSDVQLSNSRGGRGRDGETEKKKRSIRIVQLKKSCKTDGHRLRLLAKGCAKEKEKLRRNQFLPKTISKLEKRPKRVG